MTQSPPPLPPLLEQANAELQAGRVADAEASARQVVRDTPDNPTAWHIAGLAALRQGRPVDAIRDFSRAASLNDGNAMIWMHLGIAQGMTGDMKASVDSLRAAIDRDPDLLAAHLNLGLTLTNAGRPEEAEVVYRGALTQAPENPGALEGLGNALLAQHRPGDAIDAFERALKGTPNSPVVWGNLGLALLETGEPAAAADAIEQAIALQPDNPDLVLNLGSAFVQAGRMNDAIAQFRKALDLRPGWAAALGNLADSLEKSGRLDEARNTAEQALALVPAHDRAQLVLAELALRAGDATGARDILVPLADAVAGQAIESAVLNRLGHALDRLGETDRAFGRYARAQELAARKPAAQAIDRDRFPARVARNASGFNDTDGWARAFDDGIQPPVFLVGFPRSGTTLVERMLDSHPALVCSDERDWLDRTLVDAMTAPRPDAAGRLSDDDIVRMRAEYLSLAHDALGRESHGLRIVDKNPLNIVQLGYVRRIFPESPILVALRDPRDVVLSCFFQTFRPNMAMVHFLTLDGTATLYGQVMDLWLKQRDSLALNTLEFKYEDVVDDAEAMARRLVDFIGVPWDDAVLRYAETTRGRYIATPSRSDVAGTVHNRAVGRWHAYEKALRPVMGSLQRFVDAFGYGR